MINLSKRLQCILEMTPMGVAADIGADHGKLIIALFKEGIISHGYAVENKVGPYNRLVKALESEKLLDDIIPLLSDGIKDIPDTCHTVIIAGMGGNNIIDILKKYPRKTKIIQTLIVDAHSAIPKMREEVTKLGFVIADEKIIMEDEKYYEIIKFIRSDIAVYGDKDFEFGPILRKEKSCAFKEKYEHRLIEINALLKKNDLPKARVDQLNDEKKRIERVL